MSTILQDFLEKFRTNNKNDEVQKEFTHTSMHPKGAYAIPEEYRKQLYKLIIDTVYSSKNPRPVSLTERPYEKKPITIDFDFRYNIDNDRQHTNLHIEMAVKLYNEAIREFLDITVPIEAYVFEREDPYVDKGNKKDGIHFLYPNIVCDTVAQHAIRNYVLERADQIFNNPQIGVLPIKNSYDTVIDKQVVASANWTLYGCSKPGRLRYELTHRYISSYDDIDNVYSVRELPINEMTHLERIEFFSIHKSEPYYPIRADKMDIVNPANARKTAISNIKSKEIIKIQRRRSNADEDPAEIEEARNLTRILSDSRAYEYEDWINVGQALCSISDLLLPDWIEFSKRSPNFKEGECEKKWATFNARYLTISCLHRWARLDNPHEYNEIMSHSVRDLILKSVTGTTDEISNVIQALYKYQYVCVSGKGQVWYEFINNRWEITDSGISLKKKIGSKLVEEYLRVITSLNIIAMKSAEDVKDMNIFKAKNLMELTYKLRDVGFKEKLFKECIVKFYNKSFLKSLDSNPYLIGFDNGVYDLKSRKFREALPEDHITKTVGYDYPTWTYDESDPRIQEIHQFLSQIWPKPGVKEFGLRLMASFLQGENAEQLFVVMTGTGGNGKTLLITLLTSALGSYANGLPVSLLTQKRASSNAAQPELARLPGVRFAYLQEPEENSRINTGLMKELTGGDKIPVRTLYGETFEFKPQAKIVLMCNDKPTLPPDDDGTWRRMCVVEFVSKFKDDPDPKNPYHFKRDRTLESRISGWREAFMLTLLHYYNIYRDGLEQTGDGLKIPQEIKDSTEGYRAENDVIADFKRSMIVPDENSIIRIEQVYNAFKQWFGKTQTGKPPSRNTIKQPLERRLGTYDTKKGWKGWRLLELDDQGIPIDPNEPPEPSADGNTLLIPPT